MPRLSGYGPSLKISVGGKVDVQFGSVLHGRHTQELRRRMVPLLTKVPMHLVAEAGWLGGKGKNPTNRQVCRLLATQNAEAAPYIEVLCQRLDVFELGHKGFDMALTLQVYRGETTAGGGAPQDLLGWNRAQNLLPAYNEIDTGLPVLMEVWPAFGPEGPDSCGRVTLKCTCNVRRPGYEFLGDEWAEGISGALEDAMVTVLADPDGEFYMGW